MGSRVFFKATSILIIFSFILPIHLWAFEAGTYGSPTLHPGMQNSGKSIVLPSKLGLIQKSFPGMRKTIIHIQDLHCNYEVQKNIAGIIHLLAAEYGVKLVAEEGASGPVILQPLAGFPIPEISRALGDYFVKQGRLTGAEFYGATGDYPIELNGIETPALYDESLSAARFLLTQENLGYCQDIREALDSLKPGLYNPALTSLDQIQQAYRLGKLDALGYAVHLWKQAGRRGIKPGAYSHLEDYVNRYRGGGMETEVEPLVAEMAGLERELRDGLYTRQAQRELDEQVHRLDIIEKLLNISATQAELGEFRSHREQFQIQAFDDFLRRPENQPAGNLDPDCFHLNRALNQAELFYRLADARSRQFSKNLLEMMDRTRQDVAVVITGGFHTNTLLAEIQNQGVGYVSVKPRLTRQAVVNPYFNLLKGGQLPLEKLLAKNQTNLAVPIWPGTPSYGATLSPLEAALAKALRKEGLDIREQRKAGQILNDIISGNPEPVEKMEGLVLPDEATVFYEKKSDRYVVVGRKRVLEIGLWHANNQRAQQGQSPILLDLERFGRAGIIVLPDKESLQETLLGMNTYLSGLHQAPWEEDLWEGFFHPWKFVLEQHAGTNYNRWIVAGRSLGLVVIGLFIPAAVTVASMALAGGMGWNIHRAVSLTALGISAYVIWQVIRDRRDRVFRILLEKWNRWFPKVQLQQDWQWRNQRNIAELKRRIRENEETRICLVCQGNMLTSPLATAALSAYFKTKLKNHLSVSSAGLRAFPGVPFIIYNPVQLGREGFDGDYLANARTRVLNQDLIHENDFLILLNMRPVVSNRFFQDEKLAEKTILMEFPTNLFSPWVRNKYEEVLKSFSAILPDSISHIGALKLWEKLPMSSGKASVGGGLEAAAAAAGFFYLDQWVVSNLPFGLTPGVCLIISVLAVYLILFLLHLIFGEYGKNPGDFRARFRNAVAAANVSTKDALAVPLLFILFSNPQLAFAPWLIAGLSAAAGAFHGLRNQKHESEVFPEETGPETGNPPRAARHSWRILTWLHWAWNGIFPKLQLQKDSTLTLDSDPEVVESLRRLVKPGLSQREQVNGLNELFSHASNLVLGKITQTLLRSSGALDTEMAGDGFPISDLLKKNRKKVGILISHMGAIPAAKGLIQALGLEKEEITIGYLEFMKEVVDSSFQDYTKVALEDIDLKDFISFYFSDQDIRGGILHNEANDFILSHFPLKYSREARQPGSLGATASFALPRKVVVVGSPTPEELTHIIGTWERLFAGSARQDRPLLIAALANYTRGKYERFLNRKDIAVREAADSSLEDFIRQASGEKDILFVGTKGELRSLYGLADLCYVGADRNIMEPAAFGKPIFYNGSDTQWINNGKVLGMLKAAGAVLALNDVNLRELLSNETKRVQMGEKVFSAADSFNREQIEGFSVRVKLALLLHLALFSFRPSPRHDFGRNRTVGALKFWEKLPAGSGKAAAGGWVEGVIGVAAFLQIYRWLLAHAPPLSLDGLTMAVYLALSAGIIYLVFFLLHYFFGVYGKNPKTAQQRFYDALVAGKYAAVLSLLGPSLLIGILHIFQIFISPLLLASLAIVAGGWLHGTWNAAHDELEPLEEMFARVEKKPEFENVHSLPALENYVSARLPDLVEKAKHEPRMRASETIHNMGEGNKNSSPVNAMLSVLLPGTYVRPHRHGGSEGFVGKNERFYLLKGKLAVILYNDNLEVEKIQVLHMQDRHVHIRPTQWHTVVCLEESAMLEFKDGPYDPATDKEFHPSTPEEAYENGRLSGIGRSFVHNAEKLVSSFLLRRQPQLVPGLKRALKIVGQAIEKAAPKERPAGIEMSPHPDVSLGAFMETLLARVGPQAAGGNGFMEFDPWGKEVVREMIGDYEKQFNPGRNAAKRQSKDQVDVPQPTNRRSKDFLNPEYFPAKEHYLIWQAASGKRYAICPQPKPLERGHMIVASLDKLDNGEGFADQQLTPDLLADMHELEAELAKAGYLLAFNSWGAGASIDHFHCHILPKRNLALVEAEEKGLLKPHDDFTRSGVYFRILGHPGADTTGDKVFGAFTMNAVLLESRDRAALLREKQHVLSLLRGQDILFNTSGWQKDDGNYVEVFFLRPGQYVDAAGLNHYSMAFYELLGNLVFDTTEKFGKITTSEQVGEMLQKATRIPEEKLNTLVSGLESQPAALGESQASAHLTHSALRWLGLGWVGGGVAGLMSLLLDWQQVMPMILGVYHSTGGIAAGLAAVFMIVTGLAGLYMARYFKAARIPSKSFAPHAPATQEMLSRLPAYFQPAAKLQLEVEKNHGPFTFQHGPIRVVDGTIQGEDTYRGMLVMNIPALANLYQIFPEFLPDGARIRLAKGILWLSGMGSHEYLHQIGWDKGHVLPYAMNGLPVLGLLLAVANGWLFWLGMAILTGWGIAGGWMNSRLRRPPDLRTLPVVNRSRLKHLVKLGGGDFSNAYEAGRFQGKDCVFITPASFEELNPLLAMNEQEVEDRLIRAIRQNRLISRLHFEGHSVSPQIYAVVYDARGRLAGYLAERIPGKTLLAWMQSGEIEPGRFPEILRQVRSQLDLIHEAGLIHGNVSTVNTMLSFAGGVPVVRLIDFEVLPGRSRQLDDQSYRLFLVNLAEKYKMDYPDGIAQVRASRLVKGSGEFLHRQIANLVEFKRSYKRFQRVLAREKERKGTSEEVDNALQWVSRLGRKPLAIRQDVFWSLDTFREGLKQAGENAGLLSALRKSLPRAEISPELQAAKQAFLEVYDRMIGEWFAFVYSSESRPVMKAASPHDPGRAWIISRPAKISALSANEPIAVMEGAGIFELWAQGLAALRMAASGFFAPGSRQTDLLALEENANQTPASSAGLLRMGYLLDESMAEYFKHDPLSLRGAQEYQVAFEPVGPVAFFFRLLLGFYREDQPVVHLPMQAAQEYMSLDPADSFGNQVGRFIAWAVAVQARQRFVPSFWQRIIAFARFGIQIQSFFGEVSRAGNFWSGEEATRRLAELTALLPKLEPDSIAQLMLHDALSQNESSDLKNTLQAYQAQLDSVPEKIQERLKKFLHGVPAERQRGLLVWLLLTWLAGLEAGHSQTLPHSWKVACRMAAWAAFSGQSVEDAFFSGLLHDIGKSMIRQELYNNGIRFPVYPPQAKEAGPVLLLRQAQEIIHEHSLLGYKLLSGFEGLGLNPNAALHHVHMDGSGYPKGYLQAGLPLLNQALEIADLLSIQGREYQAAEMDLNGELISALANPNQYNSPLASKILLQGGWVWLARMKSLDLTAWFVPGKGKTGGINRWRALFARIFLADMSRRIGQPGGQRKGFRRLSSPARAA